MLPALLFVAVNAIIVAARASEPITISTWPGVKERIDLFGLTADEKSIWHKFHNEFGWEPAQFENLGQPDAKLSSDKSVPTALSWADNHIQLFLISSDGKPYSRWWSGSQWEPEGWAHLWDDEDDTDIAFDSKLAAASWIPGRIDLFGLNASGTYLHKFYNQQDNSWSSWENLWPEQKFTSPPALTSWGENRFDLFGTDANGTVLHQAWTGDCYFPKFEALPNAISNNMHPHAQMTATSNGAGKLSIWAVGRNDSKLYYTVWDQSSYTAWQAVGGAFQTSAPKVLHRSASWIDIVGLADGSKGNAMMEYKIWTGWDWQPNATSWWNLANGAKKWMGQPQVASWSESTLAVFAVGGDGMLQWKFYTGEHWTEWIDLGDTKDAFGAKDNTPFVIHDGENQVARPKEDM